MDCRHAAAVSPAEAFSWLLLHCSRSESTVLSPPSSSLYSTASFRKHVRRKRVPMAFSELQELPSSLRPSLVRASSTATFNVQYMHSCRLARDLAQFVVPLPAQMQSPRSHVRTKASLGRLSGGLHGGNLRKHGTRRRSDTVEQENSYDHTLQHLDRSMSFDDVSNDSESDHQNSSDMATGADDRSDSECTADRPARRNVYDSIHGEFWMNDPYYQELEALDFRDGWQRIEDERSKLCKSSENSQEGNGAAFGIQRESDLDQSAHRTAEEEAPQTVPKETFMPLKQEVNAAEDRKEIIHGIDERNLEQRTDVKGALTAEACNCEYRELDIASISEDSCMAIINGGERGESELSVDTAALPVAEQVGRLVEQVADLISDSITEQVVTVVDQVEKLPQVAEEAILKMMDQVSEALPDPVVEQVGQVAEQVTQTAEHLAEQVTQTAEHLVEQVTTHIVEPISSTTSQIVNLLSSDEEDDESEDEFEAYTSLDIPEFKGRLGLSNFTILQEEQGPVAAIYNMYIFMLKRSLFEFFVGMLAAPILLSILFTFLYLPQFSGLAFDETVREFMRSSDPNTDAAPEGLQLSWETVFRVFMFSVSLSTGLQPELAPLSPYTLVVANLNALLAQLIFVFLSGAVFARLSQPSLPVKCSTIAVICPPANRRLRKEVRHKALLTRYVLVGPQPCELVDVKVDLTYQYNTITRSGTYFRTSQSLKLVRPEIAFLDHGMLVRHIIDETSPLYQRTQGMLEKEDAVFSLSVVGLERSSMQSVFHVQHYCVHDKDVIWDAEFVDMILISKKNQRVVDHSLLSKWRTIIPF